MDYAPPGWFGPVFGRFWAYTGSVLAVVLATAITFFLPPLHATPTDLFFVAVVLAAWFGGIGPAVLAIILSTLAVDFFLVPPVFSLLIDLADVLRVFVFAVVAIVICYLQEGYHRVANRLREANDVLEARVAERTADLAAANESLVESEAKLRQALDKREVSLREKEVLFRELQHRVKNNLQIITSLLSLQATRIPDRGYQELFKECQHRVRAISLVHQRLCGARNLASIDVAAYFDQLVRDLSRSYCVGIGSITPTVVVEETALDIDCLVPCALIVNELVCNAFKYAFPAGRSGEVRVEVQRHGGHVSLRVADDGVGFSPEQSPCRNSVGLQIVQALVDQLSGTIVWANGRGTSATITFPETIPKE